jgi:predicted phosphodiesterase
VRTLVVSDLHLGAARGRDALRRPGPLAGLVEAVRRADRLVLLGDALELRHGPLRDVLASAAPVFAALGAALGADGEIVVVPGNHDHALVAPWLEGRGHAEVPVALGLVQRAGPQATWALAQLAAAAEPARFDVAYPGIGLRADVYATHGHYLDRLITIPTFERLAAGAMVRVVGPLPPDAAIPEDFEAALAPLYAWMHAVAQSKQPGWAASRQSASARTWQTLTGAGPRTLRARAVAAAFPLAVAGLNRAGLGPIRPQLSGEQLRRAGLAAIGEVVRLLGIEAEHVIFGHTHRAGPLAGDDLAEWRAPTGALLHNPGCWIDEPVFATGGPASPYWGGRALVLDDDEPPRLERVVTHLGPDRAG